METTYPNGDRKPRLAGDRMPILKKKNFSSTFCEYSRLSLLLGREVRRNNDVTAAILVFQNNETAAILVFQTNPVGVGLSSYVKNLFCSHKFA